MAVTVTNQYNPLGGRIIKDTDIEATAQNNVTGASSTIYFIDIDNSANGAASFLKIYDHAAPTVGTTDPDWVVRVAASTRSQVVFPQGLATTTGISLACVTTGGTGGTTSPTSSVILYVLTS